MEFNRITGEIVDSAMKVHTALGPGLLEFAYEACLIFELRRRGLKVQNQLLIPIIYDGMAIDAGYRVDLCVEQTVLVELKAVEKLLPIHRAQILSYIRLAKKRVGLLINFNVRQLKHGIHRFMN